MSKNNLNVVVIGSSAMAEFHMKGVMNYGEGVTLYGVCDIHEEYLTKAKENVKFGDEVKLVTDYKEFVNDKNVDIAVIVTPDQTHEEITNAFLYAGKDVLCEKPMALTMEECYSMMKAEKESGRRLMIGQVCRFTPAFIMAKELVSSGRIGELYFVESEYAHDYLKARGVDEWRVTPERHGIIGGGCHAIDLLRWIAGNPTEVTAHSVHKLLKDWPAPDTSVAIFKFPSDVIGKVFVSISCKRDYTMRSVFYGTKGTIICDNTSTELTLYEMDENGEGYTTPKKLPVVVNNHNVTSEFKSFVDALRSGADTLPCSSLEGASTVAVCRAAVESYTNGESVKIKYPEL